MEIWCPLSGEFPCTNSALSLQVMTNYVVDPKRPPELIGVKGDRGNPGLPGLPGPQGIRVSVFAPYDLMSSGGSFFSCQIQGCMTN